MSYSPKTIAERLLKNSSVPDDSLYNANLSISTPLGYYIGFDMLLLSVEEPLEARYSIVSKINRDKVLYLNGILPAVWSYEAYILNIGNSNKSAGKTKDFLTKEWLDGVASGEIQAYFDSKGVESKATLTYLDKRVVGIIGSIDINMTSDNNKLAMLKFSLLIPSPTSTEGLFN